MKNLTLKMEFFFLTKIDFFQRLQEREMLRKKRQKDEEKKSKLVNNDSKIMDLDYENLEFKPDMVEEPKEPKVEKPSQNEESILIKKQSKDESSEVLKDVKSTVLQTLNEIGNV